MGPVPNRAPSGLSPEAALRGLSPLGLETRRHDRDRFVTALFAPAHRRESLFALYAFNAELARIRESVSEPLLGEMRLQWWRDTIAALYEGRSAAHPVAIALGAAIRDHGLSRHHVDLLIDTRSADLTDEPPADLAALESYAAGTAGTVSVLAAEALGAHESLAVEAARHAGIAWGLTGILRATPFLARAGRSMLPVDLMAAHAVTTDKMTANAESAGRAAIARIVAERARHHIAEARARRSAVARPVRAALLVAPLAGIYLNRLKGAGYDLADRGWSSVRPAVLRLAIRSLLAGY